MLISAGTIAAYLALDTTKFNRSISEAMDLLKSLFASGKTGQSAFSALGNAANGAAEVFTGTLAGAFSKSAQGLREAAQSYALSMSDASVRVSEKASATKKSLLSIGESASGVRQGSAQIAEAVKSPLKSLDTSAYSIMSNVGLGLNRGLADKKSLIVSTAGSIAGSVVSTLKSALKIASPSKVMKKIGEQTVQGLAIGLNSGVADIGRSAEAMANSITERQYSAVPAVTAQTETASLAGRLDQLIALLSNSEQVMQVDGRAFARLIREYT